MKKTSYPENLQHWTNIAHERIMAKLPGILPVDSEHPQTFHRAMHYVMQNGGKRLRPMLVYLTNDMLGGRPEQADAAAIAVELIHTYSLVHDDLPAMDDDDLRRGQPSCHRAFDEATAILVGDALQALAFDCLANDNTLEPLRQMQMVKILSRAAFQMCQGQALDTQAIHVQDIASLKRMHQLKTGALIKASILLGAQSANITEDSVILTLEKFAECVGLAFQVQDDVLDITSSTEQLGKPQGSDQNQDKTTYPSLMGLEKARDYAKELCDQGKTYLKTLNYNSTSLCSLSDYINQRVV